MTAGARPDEARLEPLRRSGEQSSLPLAAESTIVSLTFDDGYGTQYGVRPLLARLLDARHLLRQQRERWWPRGR